MANPYREAEKQKKKAPGSAQEPPKTEEKVAAPSESEKPVSAPSDDFEGLLDRIELPERRAKKTRSLYMSDEVYNELERRAKKAKMSKARYLDEVLSKLFGLK